MLRETVDKLLHEDLNKNSCVRVVEAIHASFSPRISWVDKCKLILKLHEYKLQHNDWTVMRTAKYLELSYNYVLESLRLARAIDTFPNIKYIRNRKKAIVCLQSTDIVNINQIDDKLIEKNFKKKIFKVDDE